MKRLLVLLVIMLALSFIGPVLADILGISFPNITSRNIYDTSQKVYGAIIAFAIYVLVNVLEEKG